MILPLKRCLIFDNFEDNNSMFNSLQKYIDFLPLKVQSFKVKYSEQIAIIKKTKFFSDVKWTEKQQKEFDEYWINNYGKKIKPWWNKLYESMNGVYHKDYFPEILYSTKLEPLLNSPDYCRVFNDKSLISLLYGTAEKIVFSKAFLVCCNGTFCDGEHRLMGENDALLAINDIGECVIKPTVDTGSGHGVHILNIVGGKDIKTGKTTEEIIKTSGRNFIIQKKIHNSEKFSHIYPASLNTVRIISYIVDNEVHCAPAAMRIGAGGQEIDNIHNGGLCVGVNNDGTLKSTAYQLGYGDKLIKYSTHPDTGVVFENYYIGNVKKLLDAAEELHLMTPYLGIISWDLTLDEEENVVLIEANCSKQSVWFPQIVNEEPLFGKDTQYMIEKMRIIK